MKVLKISYVEYILSRKLRRQSLHRFPFLVRYLGLYTWTRHLLNFQWKSGYTFWSHKLGLLRILLLLDSHRNHNYTNIWVLFYPCNFPSRISENPINEIIQNKCRKYAELVENLQSRSPYTHQQFPMIDNLSPTDIPCVPIPVFWYWEERHSPCRSLLFRSQFLF